MVLPSFSVKDKVVLITGARRGLGRALALGFAEGGSDLSLCDKVIEDGELEAVAQEVKKLGRRVVSLQVDVTKKAEIENWMEKTLRELGKIDVLINNVAMNIAVPLLELREDGLDKIITTDLKSYFLCCQVVGRYLVQQKKGIIINISSTGAERASPNMSVYHSAKAGVKMLTQSLAVEWAPYNIRVNAIGPVMMRTKFSEPLFRAPEALKRVEERIPLAHRLAEPEEMVGTAIFLASEASSFITGQTIYVDGGTLA